MSDFTYQVVSRDGRVTVVVGGELDMYSSVELKNELLAIIDRGSELVLALGGLTFIDSGGLSVFIAGHKRALQRGSRMLLSEVPPFLSRMLAVTGLATVIPVLGADDAHAS